MKPKCKSTWSYCITKHVTCTPEMKRGHGQTNWLHATNTVKLAKIHQLSTGKYLAGHGMHACTCNWSLL